jgi:hypothetical protein
MTETGRCTTRKHVIEKGSVFCDCRALMAGPTAAKNALVVTVIDPLQDETLTKIEAHT